MRSLAVISARGSTRSSRTWREWGQLAFLLVGSILVACQTEDVGSSTRSIEQNFHVPHSMAPTNIDECDHYLALYEECIESQVPSQHQAAALEGLAKTRNSWMALGSSSFERASLKRMCVAATRSAEKNLNCYWSDDGSPPNTGGSSGGGTGGGSSTGGTGGGLSETCSLATAAELGAVSTPVTISNSACMKIETSYPDHWDSSNKIGMQTLSSGTYPTTITWSNSCSGNSGSVTYTSDHQYIAFGPVHSSCPTLLIFSSPTPGTIGVNWWSG